MLRDRFSLLLQRTLRTPGFQAPLFTDATSSTASSATARVAAVTAAAAAKAALAHLSTALSQSHSQSAAAPAAAPVTLTSLDSLISRRSGAARSAPAQTVLGLLTRLLDRALVLEDLNSAQHPLTLDLTGMVDLTDGIVTDHCVVMAQGVLKDEVFVVSELAFPPPEAVRGARRCVSPSFVYGLTFSLSFACLFVA
jgi:hypothetical protein